MELGSNPQSVANSQPGPFEFYHLGRVEPSSRDSRISGPGVAFWIYSERGVESKRHLYVASFAILELSDVYAEMGNVLASRFATLLSGALGETVMISPPQILSAQALDRLLQSPVLAHRQYLHHHENRSVPVETWVIEAHEGAQGYA